METKKVDTAVLCTLVFMVLILNLAATQQSANLHMEEQQEVNSGDSIWNEMKPRGPVPPSGPSQCQNYGRD